MIELKPITEDNFLDAFDLKLAPGQEEFVSHPIRSLAQAYVYRNQCTPFGVYAEGRMVGYVMVIFDYDIPEYDIWHMMIDASEQGRGFGSEALDRVLEYVRTKPFGDCPRVALTCNKKNLAAMRLYERKGFRPTGAEDGDEIEMALYLERAHRERPMRFENAYFITGNAYAGKSTMIKLLAERHGGVLCGENWHDEYPMRLDTSEFPALTYTRDLEDWHDFIRRTPEEYNAWIERVQKECEILELRMLPEKCAEGKPVFVDTNISPETLHQIAEPGHVLVMLAEPETSVRRFFERPDAEKQFLYRLIMEEPDPAAAMENYRRGLELINSKEKYEELLCSGFPVIKRDDARSIEKTLALVEEAFGLE